MEALEPKERAILSCNPITRLKRDHLTRRCKGRKGTGSNKLTRCLDVLDYC